MPTSFREALHIAHVICLKLDKGFNIFFASMLCLLSKLTDSIKIADINSNYRSLTIRKIIQLKFININENCNKYRMRNFGLSLIFVAMDFFAWKGAIFRLYDSGL